MKKICNQFFVKDAFRDKRYTGTMKCACCLEETNLPETFPFYLESMSNHIRFFKNMHTLKGCNNDVIESPEWASGEINFGITI